MKVECERKDLLEAVGKARRAVSTRATLPVLHGLRLTANGKLEVAGTDLEMSAESAIGCRTADEGSVIVPSKLFAEVLKVAQGDTVAISAGDGEVEIFAGRSAHRMKTIPRDDYPALPIETDEPTAWTTVSAYALETAIGQVVIAASGDESRQVLTGVLVEVDGLEMTLAATDSYRLAVKTIGHTDLVGNHSFIVPARILREVMRLAKKRAEVRIGIRDQQVMFVIGDDVIGSRFIEGDFPKYRQLIPAGCANVAKVDGAELIGTIKRVGLMAQNSLPMKLILGGGGLAPVGWRGDISISAHTPDVGEAEEVIEAEYAGDVGIVIAFNPDFLADGVHALGKGAEVEIAVADGLKPAIIRNPADDSYLYLLMPVRLS